MAGQAVVTWAEVQGYSVVLSLSGVSATGSAGTVSPVFAVALSGNAATSAIGSPAVGIGLAGIAATGSQGTVSTGISAALSGVEATGSAGSIGQFDVDLAPESIESAEAFGTPSIALGAKPGIVAPAVWPSDAVFRDLWIRPNGIRSAESFGVVTIELEQPVRGIEAQESLGRARISVSIRTQSIGMSDVMGRIAPELEIGGFSIETRAEVSRAFTALGPRHRKQRDAEVWLLRR